MTIKVQASHMLAGGFRYGTASDRNFRPLPSPRRGHIEVLDV